MGGKNIKITMEDFLGEQYIPDVEFDTISFVNDSDAEVLINTARIKEMFSFVGDGIYDIKYSSVLNKTTNEWSNEVIVEFNATSTGNIDHSTWDKLTDMLESMLGKNGFIDYNIIGSSNKVILDFTELYQMGY
jgi:hypothetical protein